MKIMTGHAAIHNKLFEMPDPSIYSMLLQAK